MTKSILIHIKAQGFEGSKMAGDCVQYNRSDSAMAFVQTVQNSQYVDDGEPWQYLRTKGFRQKSGIMKSPVDHRWNDEDRGAVQYLCDEWGWTWSGQEI
jgi:hypothetical protein